MKYYQLGLLVLLMGVFSCQSSQKETAPENQLGSLNYDFEISDAAKESFDKGLLLLHSFEYEDAQEAFQEAIKKDDTEVMAYWGEAMTYYKALWGLQDVEAGRAVIARLGEDKASRLKKIENELERDFWEGVEILYGEGDLNERNKTYANHMSALYDKYEGNQEVAAFYALGLMWSVEEGRDPEVFDLSANVVSGILEENPNHPGALHYLIHANDDPDYAQLSMLAANKYDEVAPDATHALHMPSHIYLALGMWNDMVAANERSYAASINRMERKGLDDKARGYHSYAWLHYGYLQQGRFEKAAELLKDMQGYLQSTDGLNSTKRYLIDMQTAQRVESGSWDLDFEPVEVDYKSIGLHSKASQHLLKGIIAFEAKDMEKLQAEIDTLEMRTKVAAFKVTNDGVALCSAGPTRYAPSRSDVLGAKVVANEMKALLAQLKGDEAAAEQLMIEATKLEDDCEYSYGPPRINYPSYEFYGDWLMTKDRYEEAVVQFDKSLAIGENRAKALKGKIAAFQALGKTDEAEAVQKTLNQFWKQEMG